MNEEKSMEITGSEVGRLLGLISDRFGGFADNTELVAGLLTENGYSPVSVTPQFSDLPSTIYVNERTGVSVSLTTTRAIAPSSDMSGKPFVLFNAQGPCYTAYLPLNRSYRSN